MSRSTPAEAALRGILTAAGAREKFRARMTRFDAKRVVEEAAELDREHQLLKTFRSLRHRLADAAPRARGDSAVLVPLIERGEDRLPWVLFTHRAYSLRKHRGEICFPGGRIDADETLEETALRETREEIAIAPANVKIWGQLPPLLTRDVISRVTPIVGVVNEEALEQLRICTDEVQSVFIVPLTELIAATNYTAFRIGKHLYRMPVFESERFRLLSTNKATFVSQQRYRIWGLSAGILSELIAILVHGEYLDRAERARSRGRRHSGGEEDNSNTT